MKEARYWMWPKNHNMSSHIQASSYNDSWEEQAFAEDSAGPLGGCIWPPRSYSCSFCRREFRSAQALGGHMNVHRRDRARLKQFPSPHNEILHQHHQNHQNPCASLVVQNPTQVCTLVYKPNLNSDPSDITSPLSPSRVSVPSTQENCSEQTLVSPSFSSIIQEQQKVPLFSCPSWPDPAFVNVLTVSDSRIEEDKEGRTKVCQNKPDPAVILNLLVRQNRSSELGDGDEETISSKRRRSDVTSLPSFVNSSSIDRHHFQAEVLGLGASSMEDLDLELRLGDRPKVKSDFRTQMPE